MLLTLKRDVSTDTATLGSLYVDGAFECYTLENPVRSHKIDGITAIPCGTFPVIMALSPHFSHPHGPRICPHLLSVPGFAFILIHAGNTSKDTLGCILVGQQKGPDSVYQSRAALAKLIRKMWRARKEGITITIS